MRVYTRPRPPPTPRFPQSHLYPKGKSKSKLSKPTTTTTNNNNQTELGRWYCSKGGVRWGVISPESKIEHCIVGLHTTATEDDNKKKKKGGNKKGLGRFAVKGSLRYMYQPPPPYCSVGYGGEGDSFGEYVKELDGRVWYLGVVGRNKVVRAIEVAWGWGDVDGVGVGDGVGDVEKREVLRRNLVVAGIVADLQMDCESVCAAVLKGCVGGVDGVDEGLVGGEVGWDVVGILKMGGVCEGVVGMVGGRKGEDGFEALRELMVAVVEDDRAISLELASAVVSMRSLGRLQDETEMRRLAEMALRLYAPLAHQLGIWFIQSELEELAFMFLCPQEYDDIRKLVGVRLKESRSRLQDYKEKLERAICSSSAVVNNARSIRVKGRVKGIYSTYRKMKRSKKNIDEIYDLLALRVLVQPRGADEKDEYQVCYDILESVKSHFDIIHGRYKDYIAYPKPNGYKSLHATICPGKGLPPIEIQIRTEKMHHVAEFGAAAHWIYQEDTRRRASGKIEGVDGKNVKLGKDDHEDHEDGGDGNGNGNGNGGEELRELKIPTEAELGGGFGGARGSRMGRDNELEIVHSRRKGYWKYLSAAIRGSWVIVNSAGKLYKMAVGSTLMDLAMGMGLASFNAIAMVNGTVAPLTQRLEMNDMVRFVSEIP